MVSPPLQAEWHSLSFDACGTYRRVDAVFKVRVVRFRGVGHSLLTAELAAPQAGSGLHHEATAARRLAMFSAAA